MRNAALTPALLRTGRFVARLLRLGLPMGPLRILETTGRISRQPRTTPVVLTRHQDEDWLVSPFGDTDWVRNVRTQPNVHLIRLRRRQAVHLTEVDPDTAAPVLQTFFHGFRLVPFVPPAFTAVAGSDLAAFLAEAHRHPVFHVSTAPGSLV
ncbi:MAG TPA: nitroreductase family deazaflavin-dependent oxidoreductase [Acidimicrobiia bacterium]